MDSKSEKMLIQAVLPKLYDLGLEGKKDLQFFETPVDTGDLKSDTFATIDDVTGVIEVGWDESLREKPHGFYVEFGTSRTPANPAVRRAAYKKRKNR